MSEPFAQYPYGQYSVPEPPRKRRGLHALGLTATAVVALAAGAGAGIALSHGSSGSGGGVTATSKTALTAAQIAKDVDPGLVDINTTLGYQGEAAAGTGIVLTSNGEVLTNNHVIEGATSITVTDIGNGKTYRATVVGYDQAKDVAVLKLSGASGLKTASIGNSSTVSVGEQVVALGNAGGVGGLPSVAPGQVVALNQSIAASDAASGTTEHLSGMIESNADIQPGDSGGSLVNQYGQVIGMDTAASTGYQITPYGGYGNGYGSSGSSSASTVQGYSIPINTAISIADQIEAGHASSTVHVGATAFLGVEIGSTAAQGGGVQVTGTVPGTPAAAAGLTPGDMITSVAGKQVDSFGSIEQILEGYHPGDKITIGWTGLSGQAHTATVTLASGPAD